MNQLTRHGIKNLNSIGPKIKRTRDYHPELMNCDHEDTEVINLFGGDIIKCSNPSCGITLHTTKR